MQPELECFRREMGAEFLDEHVAEVGVLAFAEELPEVLVAECCEGGDL